LRSAVATLGAALILGWSVPVVAAGATSLDRHAPVLVYGSEERDYAQSVEKRGRAAVYGHRVRESGRTWLQYWLYFAYNSQDRGILRTGRHEGDWELLQIRLGRQGAPDLVTLSQHSWAAGCEWRELEREGPEPVVYVANGSHALYPRAGTADRPFPDPNDEADGRGRRVRPPVRAISDGRPGWVERREPWGDSDAGWVPGEQSSPLGPKFQEGGAWADPAGFHDDRARDCFAGPPGRAWQTGLTVAALVVLLAAAVVLLRRRFIQSRR
jgi:Vacuolar protein sorting-associated protein 62